MKKSAKKSLVHLITLVCMFPLASFAQIGCEQTTQETAEKLAAGVNALALAPFTGKSQEGVKAKIIMNENPDFAVDAAILNAGNAQAATILVPKKELSAPKHAQLKALIDKIDSEGISNKEGTISYLKMAYILPGAKASDFQGSLLMNKNYVEKTNPNLVVLDAGKPGHLKTSKKIPVLKDAETVFELAEATKGVSETLSKETIQRLGSLNEALGAAGKLSISALRETNYAILAGSYSLTHYYDLPDNSGVLVVTHTLAAIDYDKLNWVVRKAVQAVAEKSQEANFKEESSFMIDKNREFFKTFTR